MEPSYAPRSGHPVAAAVACVHEALDAVADAPVWSLSEAEAGATLLDLSAEIDRLQELRLRVAAHAHSVEVGDAVGCDQHRELVGAPVAPDPARRRTG